MRSESEIARAYFPLTPSLLSSTLFLINILPVEMLRKMSIAERFAMMESWSQFIREVAKQGIRQDYPSAVALMLVACLYRQSLAERVRVCRQAELLWDY